MPTSTLGAGACGAGSAFAGYGSPATLDAPGDDTLPTARGVSGTCRYLDPETRDYVVDTSGDVEGMSSAGQLVWLALAGLTNGPPTLSDQSLRTYETQIRTALQPLVARQVITVGAVTFTRGAATPTRLGVGVTWTDTLSGHETTTQIV